MTLLLPRRSFLGVLGGLIAAPIVCKVQWLMPVRQLIITKEPTLASVMEILVTDGNRIARWVAAYKAEATPALVEKHLLPQYRRGMDMASSEYQEVLIGRDAKGRLVNQIQGHTCYLDAADS